MTTLVEARRYPLSTQTVLRRAWIRSENGGPPFVWNGLLPLLGLLALGIYALAPFARGDVEATVLQETRAALDAAGQGWAQVEVSGQHVLLKGTPPAGTDAERALQLARDATCPTWLRRATCAVAVTGEFAAAQAQAPAPTPPAPAPTEAAVQAAAACERTLADILARSKIEFATASADISPRSAELLDSLAKAASQCEGKLQVNGHTDARGTAQRNQALSLARAQAVLNALVQRGLDAQRLSAEGFGATQPLAGNDNEEGRAKNRRIEVRVAAANRP